MRDSRDGQRVSFLSNHCWASKRRAGFHGLAEAFRDAGWTVRFVTTGLSHLSFLKSDPRTAGLEDTRFNRWHITADGIESFVYRAPIHPFSRASLTDPVTDRVFAWAYRRCVPETLWRGLADSDLVIFESSAALLHVAQIRARATRARLVYRVSDDVRVVGMAPSICRAEDAVLADFDLVSVPSRILRDTRFSTCPQARVHPHGLDLPRLRAARAAPAPDMARPSCVSLGTTMFDGDLLDLCARARPDIWFHVIGAVPARRRPDPVNIVWWGERPFAEALRFAAHCDIAAAFYRHESGTAYLAETSNKIAQYLFFEKPIVGPRHLTGALPASHFVAIDPEDPSGAGAALDRASALAPPPPSASLLRPWSTVRAEILHAVGLAPEESGPRAARPATPSGDAVR